MSTLPDDITKTTSDFVVEERPKGRIRRLLTGKRTTEPQRYWGFEHQPRRHGGTGGAKANPDHPSRKHDLEHERTVVITPSSEIQQGSPGLPRRRDRRPELIAQRKAAKAARKAPVEA